MPFSSRIPRLALLVLVTCLAACSSRKEAFLHSFREEFSITDQEIRSTQFYLSSEILAKTAAAPTAGSGTMTESVIVPAETPGVVTDVGPTWIRLRFKEGRSGVNFCTSPAGHRDADHLASEVPGKKGLHILQDAKDKVLIHEGRRYAVTYGTSTTLLIDVSAVEDLKEKRMTVPGMKK